jgi:hypothetical protein
MSSTKNVTHGDMAIHRGRFFYGFQRISGGRAPGHLYLRCFLNYETDLLQICIISNASFA